MAGATQIGLESIVVKSYPRNDRGPFLLVSGRLPNLETDSEQVF